MSHAITARRLLHTLTFTVAVGLGGLLLATPAHAGEIKFGEGPSSLEVDDSGKLTDAGRKTAVKELDKIPGEDAWDLRLYAKLDKGAAGPLYVEFWQSVDVMGKKQTAKVFHYEESNYDGSKHVNFNILLEGKVGFNKNRTYDVYLVQVSSKGKDLRLASAKLKLINTGREPEKDEDGDEKAEEEASEQDELDGLGGPDEEEEADEAPDEAPPETEASKKGCSVDAGAGFDGGLLLLLLGAAAARRRRRA